MQMVEGEGLQKEHLGEVYKSIHQGTAFESPDLASRLPTQSSSIILT